MHPMVPIVQMIKGCFGNIMTFCIQTGTGENNGWASSANLARFAQEIGLDMNIWTKCMADGIHSQKIVGSNEDARTLELTGTPAFFVIGPDGETTKLFGAQPLESFEKIFQEELKK